MLCITRYYFMHYYLCIKLVISYVRLCTHTHPSESLWNDAYPQSGLNFQAIYTIYNFISNSKQNKNKKQQQKSYKNSSLILSMPLLTCTMLSDVYRWGGGGGGAGGGLTMSVLIFFIAVLSVIFAVLNILWTCHCRKLSMRYPCQADWHCLCRVCVSRMPLLR